MIPRHSQQSRDPALPLNLSMTHELFPRRAMPVYHEQSAQLLPSMATTPAAFTAAWEMAVEQRARGARQSLGRSVESINATRIELRTLRQQGLGELGTTAL